MMEQRHGNTGSRKGGGGRGVDAAPLSVYGRQMNLLKLPVWALVRAELGGVQIEKKKSPSLFPPTG